MSLNHPCERRVDGDRVTMMVPADDWLNRSDANQLKVDAKARMAPSLPRHATRDHLHDRNRHRTVIDPASPGTQQYVRVTRRRYPNADLEEAALRQTEARILEAKRREALAADEANELMELRSMGIKASMAANANPWSAVGRGRVPPNNPRADSLEKSVFGTVDTVAERLTKKTTAGYQAGGPSGTPGRTPAAASASVPTRGPLRGGWPVK